MSYQIEMFESEKSWFYLTIYDQFYLNCSGVCNNQDYIREKGGNMNYSSTSLPQLRLGLIESWKLCLDLCSSK